MAGASSPTRLRRELGLVDVVAISSGAMFSSGFFLLPGIAFSQAGPWIVVAYALSALLVIPSMWSAAELASAMPRAGGAYYYLDRSMGPLVGTIGGLGTWIAMGLKNTFALIGIGAYLSLFVDIDLTKLAVGLALLFTAINIVGTKETARLQRGLVAALVGILAAFLFFGYIDVVSEGFGDLWISKVSEGPDADVDGVLATVGLVFVSYAGLTKVAGIAEEVQRPDRNILLGMLLSLALAASVYTLGTLLLVLVIPAGELANDLAPLATAAETAFSWMPGRIGVGLMVVAALAAFASTANAGIMAASRYLLAMGRDRLVGTAFQRVGRFKTPTIAVLATGGMVVLCLLTLDVVSVAKLASAFQLLMFAFINLAVIVMRESRIQTYDPAVRTPLYPWVQLMGIFLSLALIIEMGRMPMLFTLALVALCVGWYFAYAKERVVRQGAILHWFERLGRDRFDALEDEMWTILKETGLRDDDPYEELVRRAPFIDLEGPGRFETVARDAAERVQFDTEGAAQAFTESVLSGLVPVANGVALVHARLPGQKSHELVVVRAREGVKVDVDADPRTPDDCIEVQALFFLVSPMEDPGQHLRLLGKLTSQSDAPEFVHNWQQAPGVAEIRHMLIDDVLTRLARRLTRDLQARPTRAWHPHSSPGRFESVMVVNPSGKLSEEVIRLGADISRRNTARLTLAEPEELASDELLQAARELRSESMEVHTLELPGTAWFQCVQEVLNHDHDLLVVQNGRPKVGFDSPTLNLLRKCPCPVWVTRGPSERNYRRVLAAIDATAADETHRKLNTHILSMAAAVAEQLGAELHLVHAWTEVGADVLEAAGVKVDRPPEGEADWRGAYGRLLEELLDGLPIDTERTRIHLLPGKAAEVIPEVAEREEIDLIVMGTVSRTGVSGFFIGNTAETVLQRMSCPVLAVKPPGFVTPVGVE